MRREKGDYVRGGDSSHSETGDESTQDKKQKPFCLTAGESVAQSCLNVMTGRNGSYEPRVRSAHYMLMTWNTDSRAEAQTAN